MASNLIAMASKPASNLEAVASNLEAMVSNLVAMASNLLANFNLPWNCFSFHSLTAPNPLSGLERVHEVLPVGGLIKGVANGLMAHTV